MLTVDFDRLEVGAGITAIDIGAGQGRHSFEMFRRGADVIAFDQSESDMTDVGMMFDAMIAEGQVPASAKARAEVGDALHLPYGDDTFDLVLMSEILEHVPADDAAIAEMVRILKPGGRAAVTVPRYWPEKVCWALSDAYHEVEGGHVRIYRASNSQRSWRRRDCGSPAPTTRMHCTRRTGGSSVRWALTTSATRWSAATTSCWCGT